MNSHALHSEFAALTRFVGAIFGGDCPDPGGNRAASVPPGGEQAADWRTGPEAAAGTMWAGVVPAGATHTLYSHTALVHH